MDTTWKIRKAITDDSDDEHSPDSINTPFYHPTRFFLHFNDQILKFWIIIWDSLAAIKALKLRFRLTAPVCRRRRKTHWFASSLPSPCISRLNYNNNGLINYPTASNISSTNQTGFVVLFCVMRLWAFAWVTTTITEWRKTERNEREIRRQVAPIEVVN